jgi:hypothetical protein
MFPYRLLLFVFIVALASLCNCELIAKTSVSGTYSIQFHSSVEQDIDYEVFVNGESAATGSQVYPTSAWIDFGALLDDVINVQITTFPDDFFTLYYVVYNGAGGSGTKIYDSRSTTYFPVNTCELESCEVTLYKSSFGDSTGNLYVNNQLVVEDFTGGQENFFTVNP